MASKGKGIANDSSSGERKLRDDNTSSAARKRRDRSVLQFFEDVAPEVGGESDNSDFFDGRFYLYLSLSFFLSTHRRCFRRV